MPRDRLTLPLLLLLTVVAGLLRFTALDRPSIWGDEAATYGRVAGEYQQLLDQLYNAAFPPLHYELEWWIGKGMPYWGNFAAPADPDKPRTFTPTKFLVPGGIPLTPFALRFIPALAGTLFVPAMYWLAVQLFGRRVALLAAFLTCFSAYFLVYSRDAKMYMHFWLFVVLHVASLLWWIRTRKALAWAIWMLCGLVMVGLHAHGFAVLGIDLLIVLTSPGQHWLQHFNGIRLIGLNLIYPPMLLWNAWQRETRRDVGTAWQRVAVWRHRAWKSFRLPVAVPVAIGFAVILLAAFGPLGFYSNFSQKMQQVTAEEKDEASVGELGINWVGPYNAGRKLPDYLLYTSSAYFTGWEWPRDFGTVDYRGRPRNAGDQSYVSPTRLFLLKSAVIGLLTLLAVGVIPWRKLFDRVLARRDRAFIDSRVWPVFRSRRVLWIGVWAFVIPCGFYTQSFAVPQNLLDGAASLLLKAPPAVDWPRQSTELTRAAFVETGHKLVAAWGGYVKAWQVDNISWLRAGLVGAIGVSMLAVVFGYWRAVGRGAVRLGLVLTLLATISLLMSFGPRKVDDVVWMPRYLGAMLPAFFILVAVLIDRQPVLFRWLTLGLFVAVNQGQFAARVWGDSEPPLALIAGDVVASQPKAIVSTNPEKPTFRAYTQFGPFVSPEPGGATLFTTPGRYYLRELSGLSKTPENLLEVRLGFIERHLQIRPFTSAQSIITDLRNAAHVQRFVVWTAEPVDQPDLKEEIGDRLYGQFRRVKDERWIARDHWRWIERFTVRRRTYERVPASP